MREQEPPTLPVAATPTTQDQQPEESSETPQTPSLLSATSVGSNLKDTWHTTTSGIFNRRSRSSTVGEKSRPVISSPLVPQGDSSENVNRASGIFGSVRHAHLALSNLLTNSQLTVLLSFQSWSSLVDESALADLPDRERKRQEACYEFIATEQSYVQSLQLVIEVCPCACRHEASVLTTRFLPGLFQRFAAGATGESVEHHFRQHRRHPSLQHRSAFRPGGAATGKPFIHQYHRRCHRATHDQRR